MTEKQKGYSSGGVVGGGIRHGDGEGGQMSAFSICGIKVYLLYMEGTKEVNE